MTPVTAPRKRMGTHTIERVRKPVAASTRRATRGSVLGVGHDDRLARRGHRARDPLPDGHRHLAQRARRDVALGHLPAQGGAALVQEHDRAGLGAQHLLGQGHELDEQRRQLEVGAQDAARLGEQGEQRVMARGLVGGVVQPAAQRVVGIHRERSFTGGDASGMIS